jgi:hypothetical protein
MPMQLRMFAENLYGRGPAGMSGARMLEMQMQIKKENLRQI